MTEKLVAELGTRVFSFCITENKLNEVAIEMYNTPYVLVKKGDHWQNHNSNKMEMSPELIQAVLDKVKPE